VRGSRGLEPAREGRLFKKEPWSLRSGEEILAHSTEYLREKFKWTWIFGFALAIPTLGVSIVVTALVIGVLWLHVRLTRPEYILTTERVIVVKGWLNRRAKNVALERIQEVNYDRSFWQRTFFGDGTLRLETAATEGATELSFVADHDPLRMRLEELVYRARGAPRRDDGRVGRPSGRGRSRTRSSIVRASRRSDFSSGSRSSAWARTTVGQPPRSRPAIRA
jgi:membrane protein YdbS with pleckstrin-like domain